MIDGGIPIVQISDALLKACPILTIYQKDLLKLRYVQKKKVAGIADFYNKSKGTVSPQITRALQRFEGWCKLNPKEVSEIVMESRRKTEDVEADDQLKNLQSIFAKAHKKNVLEERKIEVRKHLKEERLKELKNLVLNNPEEVATYAEEVFPLLYGELVRYAGRIRAKNDCSKALQKFSRFEEWKNKHQNRGFNDYLSEVTEGLVKEKKREHFLKNYRNNHPCELSCRKCEDEGKRVQPEFNEDDLERFVCPRCNTPWIWRCRVCSELEKDKEVDMRYNERVGEMYCKNCGHHWPVYPLEWKGAALDRRSRIIEERHKEMGSLAATEYADSIVFPEEY